MQPEDIGWVLTDALYLKAAWATPFQASEIGPGSFTTAAGRQVSAQFKNGGPYVAGSADGWTAVWLPYGDGRLVGEKGTVASAATAVGMAASAARAGAPPVTFDRPYLMVVTDRATGAPLFMARVTDPTQP